MEVEDTALSQAAAPRAATGGLAGAGLLGLAAALLPDMVGADRAAVAGTGIALLALAGLTRIVFGRFARVGLHLLGAWAALVISTGTVLAGGGVASAVFGVLMLWPLAAIAMFLPWRGAVLQAAVASTLFGAALAVRGVPSLAWAWLAVTATLGVAAVAASVLGRRLRHLASTDSRTGAISSPFWEEMVSRECSRAARSGHPLCVAVLSIDGFEEYHRSGHMAGEQFLRQAVHVWTRALRGGDLLTHMQADEFGILLPECGDAAARAVVDRLRHATPDGKTSSAGIAMWTGQETATSLVNRACEALRHARRAGRDQSFVAAA